MTLTEGHFPPRLTSVKEGEELPELELEPELEPELEVEPEPPSEVVTSIDFRVIVPQYTENLKCESETVLTASDEVKDQEMEPSPLIFVFFDPTCFHHTPDT